MNNEKRINPLNPLWKPNPVPVFDSKGNYIGQRWEAIDSHKCNLEPLDPDEWDNDIIEILGYQCTECGIFGQREEKSND